MNSIHFPNWITESESEAMTPKIRISEVAKTFWVATHGGTSAFVALDGLSLDIAAGEFVTIVGPSGCGKSTLLDLLAGLTRPTRGRVLINDREVTGTDLQRAMVFQHYALFPWRTVLGNVQVGLESRGLRGHACRERAREVLAIVGLCEFADRYPHQLSGGMKQRVAIARSLACEPDILLMDEPFGALDEQTREGLQRELLETWMLRKTTVVFVTHSIAEAVVLGQRVVVLTSHPGRVAGIVDVPPELDRQSPDLQSKSTFNDVQREVSSMLCDRSVPARNSPKIAEPLSASRASLRLVGGIHG